MAEGAADTRAVCTQTILTAAFLDGELDADASNGFDRHARNCVVCRQALLEQRRLLCLLDTAFDGTFEKRVALPEGFARRLKAHAQNDMSGVRERGERRRALKICVALAAATFALLGYAAFDAVAGPVLNAARAAGGMLGVAGHAAADAGAGAGFVLRAVGGRIIAGSETLAVIVLVAVVAAAALLLRLISAYHRASD